MARKESAKSNAPKTKTRRFAQIRQVFTAARGVDPMIGWWMALASLGTLVVMVVIGVVVHHWVYFLVLGIPTATLAASSGAVSRPVMLRRFQKVAPAGQDVHP